MTSISNILDVSTNNNYPGNADHDTQLKMFLVSRSSYPLTINSTSPYTILRYYRLHNSIIDLVLNFNCFQMISLTGLLYVTVFLTL